MRKTLIPLLLLAIAGAAAAQTSADEILNAIIDSQRGGQTSSARITMTVVRPERTDTYVIESVSDGLERALTRVVEPSRDAGQAFLQDGENLYLYNPRLRRTLRLPPSGSNDSFLGSDLSYGDLSGRDLETDYSAEVTAEDEDTVELTLTPEELAPTPYGKVVLTADKGSNFAPLEYLFYDQRGQPVRRMAFSDYTQAGDLYMPTRFEIENLLREGEETVIVMDDIRFGVDVPESCFSQRALERGCL